MPSDAAENEENDKEKENENKNEKGNGEIVFNAEYTDAPNNSNNAGPSLLIQSPLEHLLVKTGMIAHDLAEIFLAPANTNVTQKNKQAPRTIIKERVLTSDVWREKIENEEKQKKEIEDRKKLNIEKRNEKKSESIKQKNKKLTPTNIK